MRIPLGYELRPAHNDNRSDGQHVAEFIRETRVQEKPAHLAIQGCIALCVIAIIGIAGLLIYPSSALGAEGRPNSRRPAPVVSVPVVRVPIVSGTLCATQEAADAYIAAHSSQISAGRVVIKTFAPSIFIASCRDIRLRVTLTAPEEPLDAGTCGYITYSVTLQPPVPRQRGARVKIQKKDASDTFVIRECAP